MRNLSLVSILLALAIGAVVWQKQLKHQLPARLPEPAEHATEMDYRDSEDNLPGECDDAPENSDVCESTDDESVQAEMEDQRKRAYGTIMKSFDDEYGKYRKQTGGRP